MNNQQFSKEQYDMLKRCSEKKDMTEWNEWRKKNPDKDVLLEGADLSGMYLEGVLLNTGEFKDRYSHQKYVFDVNVNLVNADLRKAILDRATFSRANLENAQLQYASIRCSNLRAYLRGAKLWSAHLEDSDLWRAHIENADFYKAYIQGARFRAAQVDGRTLIAVCRVDNRTDFTGVALDNACVEPGLKQLLEYNIRRLGWRRWYDNLPTHLNWYKYELEHKPKPPFWKRVLKKGFVRTFWFISDYGRSTGRIIITFFGLALIFANIYYYWARIAPPGIVSHLLVDETGAAVPWWLVPLRTLYFSIVTMTTLGFGDMYARGQSIFGHLLLMLQVLLGYVLLGALVTRFAVLFTAGGPAGKFTNE